MKKKALPEKFLRFKKSDEAYASPSALIIYNMLNVYIATATTQ